MNNFNSTIVFTSLCFLSSFVGAQDNTSIDDYWLGNTRGPHATGTMIETWIDESRDELSTTLADDKRHVSVQLWYPTAENENSEYASYAPYMDQYQQYIIDWGEDFAERPTRSVLNALLDPAKNTYPVIIYNQGGGAPVFTGTSQTEFLASHGFVVVSVEHTDTSGRARYPDGSDYTNDVVLEIPSEEEREGLSDMELITSGNELRQHIYAWHVEDISFVLDRLESLGKNKGSTFYQRLNTENVGTMGFSIGGATSFQATLDDKRIKAAVNLDGSIGGRPVEKLGSSHPLLFIESTANDRFTPLKDSSLNPSEEASAAYYEYLHWEMFKMTTADWYRARLIGTTHYNFSDIIIGFDNDDEGLMEYKKAHEIMNALVLEFFNKYINGSTETPLLSREKSYPELRLITRSIDSDQL